MDEQPRQPVRILLDGTVLSNFARIGRLDLLERATSGRAVTTEAVADEFEAGRMLGYFDEALPEWLPVLPLSPEEDESFRTLHLRLGAGEAQCLAVAQSRGMRLATDDGDARRHAHRAGVGVSGTIGIVVGLVTTGTLVLEEANAILAEMVEQGYRSPLSSLSSLL